MLSSSVFSLLSLSCATLHARLPASVVVAPVRSSPELYRVVLAP